MICCLLLMCVWVCVWCCRIRHHPKVKQCRTYVVTDTISYCKWLNAGLRNRVRECKRFFLCVVSYLINRLFHQPWDQWNKRVNLEVVCRHTLWNDLTVSMMFKLLHTTNQRIAPSYMIDSIGLSLGSLTYPSCLLLNTRTIWMMFKRLSGWCLNFERS
jgi:hypothetical protein